MNYSKLYLLLFCVGVILFPDNGHAQDIHFSQFYNSPQNLNPALTGVFAGDHRFTANYRHQWQSVPVPYETFSGAFDTKITHKLIGPSGILGAGLLINNDRAGDGELGLTQLGINLAYTRKLSKKTLATLGMQLATGQRSVQPAKLTFAEQWDGDQFNPGRANGENFTQTSRSLSSLAAGVNIHYQNSKNRSRIDAGAGLFNLNRPETSFNGNMDVKIPRKANLYFSGTLETGVRTDLLFQALFSRQLAYDEMVFSPSIRYHLNLEKNRELAIQAGMGYRPGDAVIPAAQVYIRNWRAGLSYDINTSRLKIASLRRGGPDLFIQYVIFKVHPPEEFKSCPIF